MPGPERHDRRLWLGLCLEKVDDGRQALMRIVATLALGVPVLIDDGIVSYCIFGHELMGGENW